MKPNSFIPAIIGVILAVGGAVAPADALNPQPLPPGRHTAPQTVTNHAIEPPDPCSKSQMRKAGGEQEMRKAGGTQQMDAANVHCLNPQPLPPG